MGENTAKTNSDLSILLATHVASLIQVVSAFVFHLDILPARGKGGSAPWAKTHSPYQPCPGLRSREEHSMRRDMILRERRMPMKHITHTLMISSPNGYQASIAILTSRVPVDRKSPVCAISMKYRNIILITSWLPGFARASPSLLLPPHSLLLSTLPPSDYPASPRIFAVQNDTAMITVAPYWCRH